MLIVSQDKYNILNFDTTVNIGIEEISTLNDIVQISAQTNGNTIVLGKYKDEERANAILREIILTYSNFKLSKDLLDKNKDLIIQLLQDAKYEYFDVYEMPKE